MDILVSRHGSKLLKLTPTGEPTNVEANIHRIAQVKISPNPLGLNDKLSIQSEISQEAEVFIYNVNGQLIDVIFSGKLQKGANLVTILNREKYSGLYIIRIQIDGKSISHKLLLD